MKTTITIIAILIMLISAVVHGYKAIMNDTSNPLQLLITMASLILAVLTLDSLIDRLRTNRLRRDIQENAKAIYYDRMKQQRGERND